MPTATVIKGAKSSGIFNPAPYILQTTYSPGFSPVMYLVFKPYLTYPFEFFQSSKITHNSILSLTNLLADAIE